MGAISEKLVYLNGTKQAIKQAINEDFEVIDDNTTFRKYADEISSNNTKYKDLIPKETTNATNTLDISNSSGLDKALVTQYGNTYQETTTGKNLLPRLVEGTTVFNGKTYSVDENGILTMSGTPTGAGAVNIQFQKPYQITSETRYLYLLNDYKDGTFGVRFMNNNTRIFEIIPNPENRIVDLSQYSGQTITNIQIYQNLTFTATRKIYLMICTNNSQTTYEPYTNGASPNPDYPQEIVNISGKSTLKDVGKNLFDKNAITERSYVLNDGTLQTGTSYEYNTSDFIPVQPNTTYYKTLSLSPRTKFYDANKQVLDSSTYQDISIGGNAGTFTTPANAYYFRFTINTNVSTGVSLDSVMVHKGSEASTYEPYKEQSFDLDLKSKNLLDLQLSIMKSLNTSGTWSENVYTHNGLTLTINDDKTIKVNGTATAQETFLLENQQIKYPTGTYYLSGSINGGNNSYDIRMFNYDGTSAVAQCYTGAKEINVINNKQVYNMAIVVRSGQTLNNVVFYPMFSTSNDTNYSPYFTPIELCKIGDYKDRIYYSSGKWYLEKKIGKVTITGNDITAIYISQTNTTRAKTNFNFISTNQEGIGYSNYFQIVNNWSNDKIGLYYAKRTGDVWFRANKTLVGTTLESVQTWVNSHNVTLYYPLATPTTEEITESNYPTLYNQLNNIKLFEGVNHITMTNEGGLDVEFDITYYKDWKLD